jgi:signal transduction histidine kinase
MGFRVTLPGLPDLDLKTKLLLMMLSLLALSGASLFYLHLLSERRLISQVREYTEELSTAIDIAQQQPAGVGDPKVVLKAYTEKLRKLGVKDVTLADAADEIQASTNPDIVGKRLIQKKRPGREYVIRGVLGDSVAGVPQTTSTLTIPVVVGDRRVGYLVITRYLDDFSEQQQEAFVSRLLATLGVFGVGILLSLYLSWTFSKPLRALTKAARNVAAGDLSVRVDPGGGSEIASLSENFNEMVERLREKRQLEERLHFAERSTALGRLASAVAHEIRNPLNFINLSIDHVRERMAPADARKEDFERILRNMKSEISRLNRLVGDFLSFGKPMRLDIRSCALDEVLREVASLVDHKARDQGITLQVEAAATLPRVTADPELLKTCFLNLMINAVDAMPDGGLLTVAIREGKAEDGLPLVEVSVSDTGQGMSPEAVNSAFEPYFSTKDAGLGLGLALTHKIVSDHGGSIVLESAPDHGTTARIQLPLRASGSPATRSEDLASALVAGSR